MRPKFLLASLLVLSFALTTQQGFAAPETAEQRAAAAARVDAAVEGMKLDTLIAEGQSNYQHGRYKEAVRCFEQAQQIGAETSYQKALISLGLAEAYRSSARYKEAETLFKTSIEEAEQEDSKHLNKKYKASKKRASDLVPTMMSNLSVLYLDQSRFPECEEVLRNSIAIGIKKVGPNSTALALPYNGLTRLYLKWGKLENAKAINDKTMALFTTPQSKNNWLYAYTAFNLAQILNEKGNYKAAEALYKATLLGVQTLMGFDHEHVATALEPLGELYRKEGRYDEARKAFMQVRKIREVSLTKDHPDYGKALLDMALLYRDEGRYAKAEALCRQATKVIEKSIGSSNIEISKCWITQASIARYQGRYAEAEDLARKALELDEKLLTADHPNVAHDMVELGTILADERKFVLAESVLNKSLAISREKLGADHPDIALTIRSLAEIYATEKDFDKALPLFRSAVELADKSLGPESLQSINSKRELCDVLVALRKYSEAELLIKSVISADEKLYGQKSPQLARDLETLSSVYSGLEQKNLADSLHKQSIEISAALPGASAAQDYTATTLASSAQDRSIADKWALVVGISNFKDPAINLKYAAKDATDFKNFLVTQENFAEDHVLLLTDGNATKEEIISKLGDGWLGKHAKEGDLVMVYVSSHGSPSQEDVGVNFLVAHDTDRFKLVSTGLPLQWLTKIIQEQVHSNRVVVVLDVCHSGSAGEESKKSSDDSDADEDDNASNDSGGKGIIRTPNVDVGKLNVGNGQVVLCSSLADQISWESKNYPNSVFTRRLIEALQCRGKDTTLNEAFDRLRSSVGAEVLSDRGRVQTPNMFNKTWTGGDPVLAVPAANPRSAK